MNVEPMIKFSSIICSIRANCVSATPKMFLFIGHNFSSYSPQFFSNSFDSQIKFKIKMHFFLIGYILVSQSDILTKEIN